MTPGAADPPPRVTVTIPTALARLFPRSVQSVDLDAATVDDAIDALDRQWPGMGDRVRDSRPAIREHINVFVNGRKAELDTPLKSRDQVLVMTAISGG